MYMYICLRKKWNLCADDSIGKQNGLKYLKSIFKVNNKFVRL